MAITSIKELDTQIKAAWKKIDEIVTSLADAAEQEKIRAAVEAALREEKEKQLKLK